MSPYTSTGGGRTLNVSQYLRDLNVVKEPSAEEQYTFEEDLAAFTNTSFYDFETGQQQDYQAAPAKPETETQAPSSAVSDELTSPLGEFGDFSSITGDFSFTDFTSHYPASGVPPFAEGLGNLQPLQPNPQTTYAPPPVPQQQNHHYGAPGAHPAETRTPESLNGSRPGHSFEEQSRVAAEEDKRRRNTAASARFRIKKKQREQALEKSAKEMSDKVSQLEARINLLETENRWLKNLVMEKNEGSEDVATMLKEFQSKAKPATQTTASSEPVKDEK